MVSTVYSYIGTPPAQRQLSNLVWRLGPTHFLEEGLPAASVAAVYELGPNYTGSFQAVYLLCEFVLCLRLSPLAERHIFTYTPPPVGIKPTTLTLQVSCSAI